MKWRTADDPRYPFGGHIAYVDPFTGEEGVYVPSYLESFLRRHKVGSQVEVSVPQPPENIVRVIGSYKSFWLLLALGLIKLAVGVGLLISHYWVVNMGLVDFIYLCIQPAFPALSIII